MKAAVLCAALLVAQQISIDVDLVVFNVAVLDSKARPVKGLSKGNIRLFEDGKEQAIQFVRPEDIPATVGLVIDNSGSMRRKRAEVVQAAQEFAELSNPEDELFIVNFNERVTMGLPGGAPFTSDRDQFRTALQATRADGKTALYDAVVSALRHIETGTHQKKALIVLSDGGDNASAAGLPDVLKAAERSNATLYTIGIFDADDKDKNPKVLRRIANLTGGEAYLPKQPDEVREVWRKIAENIRSQYTIGYSPANRNHDGTFRIVTVSVTDGTGKPLRVRARKGYFVP